MTRHDAAAAAILLQVAYFRNIARRRGIPDGDVDGVVNDAMFATWKAAQNGRIDVLDVEQVRRWGNTIIRRQAANYHEAAARRAEIEASRPYEPELDPEERLAAREALRIVLARLRPYERGILRAVLDGVTLADIAVITGKRPGTVATQLLSTRMRLLAILRRK